MQTLSVWRTVHKPATRTKILITSKISPLISEICPAQVVEQKTSPWELMSEMMILTVMEMREGKIYPMFVLEGGFLHGNIFGKQINLQGVYGQVFSAFPYP